METVEQRIKFAAIVLKFVAFGDLVLEVAIFIYEVYRIQNFERINVNVRFSEEKKKNILQSEGLNLSYDFHNTFDSWCCWTLLLLTR